jgi:acetolactate synthase I/II/III large subunit
VPAVAAPPDDARVLQIDVDCAKVTMPLWSFPVELALTADTRAALPQLEEALCALATPARRRAWDERRQTVEAELAQTRAAGEARKTSSHSADAPDVALAAVDRALPDDAIVIEESVTNRAAVQRQVLRPPGHYFGHGSPALGFATGGAIGVKLARPEAPVVAVCGDGSFNFGVPTAAFFAAHRAGAPFVAVILNNHSYYASKRPVLNLYPDGAAAAAQDFPETELAPGLDYALLARACGGDGRSVETPADVEEAVRWALDVAARGRCAVVDVQLPRP